MVAERSPHPDGRVFLGCSGSEAVDTALKIARLVHQRKGDTERQVVVTRTNGYHGTNFGGTSVQGIAPNRQGWGDLVPHVIEIPNDDIEAAATVFAQQGERIAAVIAEPIQGAGGVWPPPDGYLPALRRLCDANGALLIFDEVISGFGRTGSWFGAQHFGVVPDLMTFAKAVTSGYQPVSGVICSRAVCDVIEEPGFLLRTGYTYSGHPTACAAGVANLTIMDDEGLLGRATAIGTQLREGLTALAGDGLIDGFRGDGAVFAAELGRDAAPVRNALLERGVVMRPIGTALAMCPPLVITDHEIALLVDALTEAVAAR
jgi:adenosylmethionine-8-amino-7-oxononanoate aminotransferase